MADSEAESERRITVTFNRNGVARPILRALRDTLDVVSIGINAIGSADLSNLPEIHEGFSFKFNSDNRTDDRRKADYSAWILARGFQELIRGVRQALEEAFLYLEGVKRARDKTMPEEWGEFQRVFRSASIRAKKANFPGLLNAVKDGLTESLTFEKHFKSLQRARNCLEHRDGVVGDADVDNDLQVMRLSFPRMKIFYTKHGEEIEVERGALIEGEDGRGARIGLRVVTEFKEFRLNERIILTPKEFSDIGWGCWAFSEELVRKLPAIEL